MKQKFVFLIVVVSLAVFVSPAKAQNGGVTQSITVSIPGPLPIPTLATSVTLDTDQFWDVSIYTPIPSIVLTMFTFDMFGTVWSALVFLAAALLGFRLITSFSSKKGRNDDV